MTIESEKNAPSARATLADVRPGGRVRLGDAPWPEIDAILADAYSAGAEGLPFEGIARRTAVRKAVAALSAQPSPGGQGDATIKDAYIRHFGWECGWLGDVGFGFIEGYRAALAARQPVGGPFGWLIARPDVSPFFVPASHPEIVECFRTELAAEVGTKVTEVFTAPQPPAQAVDLGGNEGYGTRYVPPEKAVGLEQFRALAEFGEGFATSAEKQPQSRVIYAQAKRLLALIDGKAVGNG